MFIKRSLFSDKTKNYIHTNKYCFDSFFFLVTLLSGARNEKNIHLSQSVYNRMKKLFPEMKDPLMAAAILLANVYASSGELDKASDIRIQMHKSGVKKQVGLTWTRVNGELYVSRQHLLLFSRDRDRWFASM